MSNLQPSTPEHNESDRVAHMFVWLGAFSMLVFFAWAYLGQLDVVSIAPGQVVPASRVKQVQHLEGGIVRKILAEEGQSVTQGQPLVILAPTRSQAEVDELEARIAGLKTDLIRLDAEIAGRNTLAFSAGLKEKYPELISRAAALFKIRRQRLASDIAVQRKLVAQRRQNQREVSARLEKNKAVLEHISEQIGISEELLLQDLTNRLKHLEMLRQEASIKGDIDIDEATLGRVKAAVDEAEAKVVNIRTNFEEEARTERDKISRALRAQTERLVKFKDSLSRTILRAPVDGIVKAIYIGTEGGVVKPGSTVLEVVPSADKLVVEARLPIQDIGYVRTGNVAQVRLASADAQLFGALDGKVVHVSPDTLVNKEGFAYYKIRIETDRAYFEQSGQRYQLYPGMQVENSIITGTRSVLDYILSPFVTSASSALRER